MDALVNKIAIMWWLAACGEQLELTRGAVLPALQGLTDAAGSDVTVSFTPHLMPFSRGMESDCYVKLAEGRTADDLRAALAKQYDGETFVKVHLATCCASSLCPVQFRCASMCQMMKASGHMSLPVITHNDIRRSCLLV